MLDAAQPLRRRQALRRGRWPLTGAIVAALLAASWALVGLVQGAAWWWLLVGFGTLLLVAPAVLRTLGLPWWAASLLDVLLGWIVVDAAYGHAFLLPTPGAVDELGERFRAAADSIVREAVPALPELHFLMVVVGGLVAILLDVLAMAAVEQVGILLLVIVAVPAFFIPRGVSLSALAGCALAYLLVLWADGRVRPGPRTAAGAAAVIAGSTAIALAVASLAPGMPRTWWRGDGGATTQAVSSLIDLGRDLQRASGQPVLTYTTDHGAAVYLELTTLEDYDGTTWTHRSAAQSPVPTSPEPEGVVLPYGPEQGACLQVDPTTGAGAPTDCDGDCGGVIVDSDGSFTRTLCGAPVDTTQVGSQQFQTRIATQRLAADWAPAPYQVQALTGSGNTWLQDQGDDSVALAGAPLANEQYTVTSRILQPTEQDFARSAALGQAAVPEDVLRADLALPADLPPAILEAIGQATAGATTPIEQARAMQAWFRSGGGFHYSLDVPDASGEDGMQLIADFLERRSGYCVHFASAMTVMARTLGIPARIVIGYAPGAEHRDGNGAVSYSVSNQELHAWPQLYFPGIGWLDFEPTTGLGALQPYTLRAGDPGASTTPISTPTPAVATSSPAATADPRPTPTRDAEAVAPGTGAGGAAGAATIWAGIAVLVVLLLLLPGWLRRGRRRRRLRELAAGGPPGLGWAEVLDTAQDLRMPARAEETPRAFATRIAASLPPDARGDLDALLLEAERGAFAPTPTAGDARTVVRVQAVLDGLELAAAPGRRALARILPASLLGRWLGLLRRGSASTSAPQESERVD